MLRRQPTSTFFPYTTLFRSGQWLYFFSNRDHGKPQIWKMPSAGGPAVQVTKNGGWLGLESMDGRFLYFSRQAMAAEETADIWRDRKSTRLNSSHSSISYAVF